MGIRQKLLARISRGSAPTDPDELIELVTVRAASGPMTVARLREDGFDVAGHEAVNLGTRALTDYRIMVRRREFERANERVKQLL